jgi:hypothetical protein
MEQGGQIQAVPPSRSEVVFVEEFEAHDLLV